MDAEILPEIGALQLPCAKSMSRGPEKLTVPLLVKEFLELSEA